MSMLSEKRIKSKYILTPRSNWNPDKNATGSKLMVRMGWKQGSGLGKNKDGIKECLKPCMKTNRNGLGFKGSSSEWNSCEALENVLLDLQKIHSTCAPSEVSSVECKPSLSLEKRSKQSKAKVHYAKFTRGKDLSHYKEEDLASVLYKKKKVKNEETKEIPSNDDIPETLDIINGGCSKSYFAKKMKKFGQKNFSYTILSGAEDNVHSCVAGEYSPGVSLLAQSHLHEESLLDGESKVNGGNEKYLTEDALLVSQTGFGNIRNKKQSHFDMELNAIDRTDLMNLESSQNLEFDETDSRPKKKRRKIATQSINENLENNSCSVVLSSIDCTILDAQEEGQSYLPSVVEETSNSENRIINPQPNSDINSSTRKKKKKKSKIIRGHSDTDVPILMSSAAMLTKNDESEGIMNNSQDNKLSYKKRMKKSVNFSANVQYFPLDSKVSIHLERKQSNECAKMQVDPLDFNRELPLSETSVTRMGSVKFAVPELLPVSPKTTKKMKKSLSFPQLNKTDVDHICQTSTVIKTITANGEPTKKKKKGSSLFPLQLTDEELICQNGTISKTNISNKELTKKKKKQCSLALLTTAEDELFCQSSKFNKGTFSIEETHQKKKILSTLSPSNISDENQLVCQSDTADERSILSKELTKKKNSFSLLSSNLTHGEEFVCQKVMTEELSISDKEPSKHKKKGSSLLPSKIADGEELVCQALATEEACAPQETLLEELSKCMLTIQSGDDELKEENLTTNKISHESVLSDVPNQASEIDEDAILSLHPGKIIVKDFKDSLYHAQFNSSYKNLSKRLSVLPFNMVYQKQITKPISIRSLEHIIQSFPGSNLLEMKGYPT